MSKICAACGELKTAKEFYKRGGPDVGARSVCIACYWKKQSARNCQWRHAPHGRFLVARKTAKMRGRSWTISEEEFTRLSLAPCHYCHRVHFETGTGLDRIDNSRGYEEGNVLPCCGTCNRIRCHLLTVEEMETAMAAIITFRAEQAIRSSFVERPYL